MQERIQNMFGKLIDSWRSLEKSQQLKIIAAASVFLIALGVTIFLAAKPKMANILENQEYDMIIQAQNALTAQNITSYPINNHTGLQVNDKYAGLARGILTQSGITNKSSGFTFADTLNYSSLGTSDRVAKEMIKRNLEDDIATDLEMFQNVKKASVTLTVPNDTVFFWEAQQFATAAVILETNREMSKADGEVIAQHVVNCVQGLDLKRVTVTDTSGKKIYNGADSQDISLATTRSEVEQFNKNEYENKVKLILGQMFSEIQVMANLKHNFDEVSVSSTSITPPVSGSDTGVLDNRKIEKSTVTSGTTAADPGTGTNNNTTPTYPNGTDSESATSNYSEEKYLYNIEQKEYKSGETGSVVLSESSIAVTVYQKREYDEKSLKNRGIVSRDLTWDEFIEQNNATIPLEIDGSIIEMLKAGTGINNIVVIGYEKPYFISDVVEPIQIQQIIILVILAILILLLAYALIRRSQPDEITEIEPELSVEDLLVSTQLEEETENERLKSLEIKESETKRQIEKFVNDKPEAVAQLLRNWINEDWE